MDSVELSSMDRSATPIAAVDGETSTEAELHAVQLAPVDGGFQAWSFVFAAFLVECVLWGLPFSYGVFSEWYNTNAPFNEASEAAINAIGTSTLAIEYFAGMFLISFVQAYPQWARTMVVGGAATCVASLFLSSFATKVWQLIILQGVLYGIGGGLIYTPVMAWVNEWFVARRSLAAGLIFGGGGLAGGAFPFFINFMLSKTTYRNTMLSLSGVVALSFGVALLGVKPRLPIAPSARLRPSGALDWKSLTSPSFLIVCIPVVAQSLGIFSVSLYIPLYSVALGYTRLQGTLALSTFNLASVFSQVLFGYLCDRVSYVGVIIFSGLGSSILAFVLWGFAHNLTLVYVFVVLLGSVGGGFTSIISPASSELSGSQPTTPFMALTALRGIGAIIGPLISAALHPSRVEMGLPSSSGWGGYGFTAITVFVGSMMAATTIGGLASYGMQRVSPLAPRVRT